MAFLVPNLHWLDGPVAGTMKTFASMALVAMEEFDAHPVVLTEGMAFFQLLSETQSAQSIKNETGSEVEACLPLVLECLSPRRPYLLSREHWKDRRTVLSSHQGLLVVTLFVKLVAESNVMSAWKEERVPPLVFALLETICGSRRCTVATFFRALSAPREADETSTALHLALETQILEVLQALHASEPMPGAARGSFLRWILLCRLLLVGGADSSGGEEHAAEVAYTRASAINFALTQSLQDANAVFDLANPCRWQVRFQAGDICVASFRRLLSTEGPDVDPVVARSEFSKIASQLSASGSDSVVPSFAVFHLSEVLGAACSAVVASLDQFELRQIQQVGIKLLSELVACYGSMPDPDEAGVLLLEQYSSQILSAAKYAVTIDEENAFHLFGLGCRCLELVLKNGLVTEPAVFKRMVRPTIPAAAEVPFSRLGDEDRSTLRVSKYDETQNNRLVALPRIFKLATTARISILVDGGHLSKQVASFVFDEVKPYNVSVGVHCAAVAIDGARMLGGSRLSLCGHEDEDQSEPVDATAGLTYGQINDLDPGVKAAYIAAWSPCLCYAVMQFSQPDLDDDDMRSSCNEWLKALMPIAFVGFHDAAACLAKEDDDLVAQSWATGLPPVEVLAFCLHGLRHWVSSGVADVQPEAVEELSLITSTIASSILFPWCGLDEQGNKLTKQSGVTKEVVVEACKFLASIGLSGPHGAESSLLVTVLKPLDALQKGLLSAEDKAVAVILPYLLGTVVTLIESKKAKESLVNAMFQLSVDLLTQKNLTDTVKPAIEKLLAACLGNEAISAAKQQAIGVDMAKREQWESWAIVCLRSDAALESSLSVASQSLADLSNAARHLGALAGLRQIVQGVTVPSKKVGLIMRGAGAQLIGLFKSYGTLSIPAVVNEKTHRMTVVADGMKILLLTYQQLSSEEKEGEAMLGAFLPAVFDLWIEVIRFNGLPNQRSPQAGADPILGRMMAQAIVHVARTTPLAFKSSMGALSDHSRAVLEFAVRSDMSGYATANTQAPAKKKLNLKNFKK